MRWKEEYSLGIQEIDAQHKLLLRGFSVIEEAINGDQGWSSVHFGIVALKELARQHFAFEEALMRLYGCPEAKEHQAAHAYFFAKLAEIENGTLRATPEKGLSSFLRTWLTEHILHTDKAYAQYILAGAVIIKSESPLSSAS